jgi:hypothetical protein
MQISWLPHRSSGNQAVSRVENMDRPLTALVSPAINMNDIHSYWTGFKMTAQGRYCVHDKRYAILISARDAFSRQGCEETINASIVQATGMGRH